MKQMTHHPCHFLGHFPNISCNGNLERAAKHWLQTVCIVAAKKPDLESPLDPTNIGSALGETLSSAFIGPRSYYDNPQPAPSEGINGRPWGFI